MNNDTLAEIFATISELRVLIDVCFKRLDAIESALVNLEESITNTEE